MRRKKGQVAHLSLFPGLVGDLDELLDLRDGRPGEVLHRDHRVLQTENILVKVGQDGSNGLC